MIDIHSHLVFGVDDGSDSLENSVNIIKMAEDAGFTDIVLTPHYIEGYNDNNIQKIKPLVRALKDAIYNENIEISLYQGNEIFLSENTPELVLNNEVCTIAHSRYVLVEVPFIEKMLNLEIIVSQILDMGYIPIIAHPERYMFIQEDPSYLIRLLKMGVRAQSNYGSIIGLYGKEAKKTVELLIQNKLIQFLGSDVHKHGHIYKDMKKILKRLKSLTGDDTYISDITTNNPKKVIEDMDVQTEFPDSLKRKNGIFKFI